MAEFLAGLTEFISSSGFKYVSAALAFVLFAVRFLIEFFERVAARKEQFLLKAWNLKHITNEIDLEMQERLMEILFLHRTGITANALQRAIYADVVMRSNGAITLQDISANIEHTKINDGHLSVVSLTPPIIGAIGFTVVALLVLVAVFIAPSYGSSILLAAYGLITTLSWKKVLALHNLKKRLAEIRF